MTIAKIIAVLQAQQAGKRLRLKGLDGKLGGWHHYKTPTLLSYPCDVLARMEIENYDVQASKSAAVFASEVQTQGLEAATSCGGRC